VKTTAAQTANVTDHHRRTRTLAVPESTTSTSVDSSTPLETYEESACSISAAAGRKPAGLYACRSAEVLLDSTTRFP
jgi:hypothetical protein